MSNDSWVDEFYKLNPDAVKEEEVKKKKKESTKGFCAKQILLPMKLNLYGSLPSILNFVNHFVINF